jgi:CRISPR-associated protein Cmr2
VLRALHQAETRAKNHRDGGRNAFCLRVMKRGGGEVSVTSRFWDQTHVTDALAQDQPVALDRTALGLMLRFAETLAQSEMSRRSVYNATEWLTGLPARDARRPGGGSIMADDEWQRMVAMNLAMQFERQKGLRDHAAEFVNLACDESKPADTLALLESLLVTAEFFAREGRWLRRDEQ